MRQRDMRHCVAEVLRPHFGAETIKDMDEMMGRLPPVKLGVLYGITRVILAIEGDTGEIEDVLMEAFGECVRRR